MSIDFSLPVILNKLTNSIVNQEAAQRNDESLKN